MALATAIPLSGTIPEAPAATPIAFGRSGRDLFGFFHAPREGELRATGVVLCNPLGYDAMCTHRTYRHLAERLATHGFPALRFDYEGTGDSSGYPEEPGRMRAWIDSIAAAASELKARSGVRHVALFGVRFGATLAAILAKERADIDALILWAPCAVGRAYVRELRAFRMIKEQEPVATRIDGDEEVAGYLFDKTTVNDMSTVTLLEGDARLARRVLVLPRELPIGEQRLVTQLRKNGAEVKVTDDSGYALMMRDPQDTIVPSANLDEIVTWLREGSDASSDIAPTPSPAKTVLSTITPSRRAVQEEALHFGAGARLFGILSRPIERPVLEGSPAVLFLNVGANHRVGPNRMYVSMARDLAAHGYFAFRFDVAGLGDSRIAPGAPENRLYSKDSVGDVKAAMDFLEKTHGTRRFILLGLCSGAYLAFHTAVEDPRVVGQVLLNPQTFEWKEGDSLELSMRKSFKSTRFYGRALLDPTVWKRVVQGRVDVRGVAGIVRERFVARAMGELQTLRAKLQGQSEPQSEIERAFVAMSDRGVESLLVFSFNDGGLDMIEKHLGPNVRKMKGRKNFQFEIVEGADHTFTPIGSQRTLHEIVMGYVTRSFR